MPRRMPQNLQNLVGAGRDRPYRYRPQAYADAAIRNRPR
jgi:hypothetical protein